MPSYSAVSDANGSFCFQNVEPGEYALTGAKAGYLITRYGSRSPYQPGTTLTVASGSAATGVVLALVPQGVISGKVLDEDGDPVDDATVQVLAQTWVRGKVRDAIRASARVNDLGEFRFPKLWPGKYFVFAEVQKPPSAAATVAAASDVRPLRTYHPAALTLLQAAPIELKAGDEISDINIQMQKAATYTVRGRLLGSLSDGSKDHAALSVVREGEELLFITGSDSRIAPDGTFDISGLAPGSYNLTLFPMIGSIRPVARQHVELGNADVNDVALEINNGLSVRGKVRIEGTPTSAAVHLSTLTVRLSPTEAMGIPGSAKVAGDGSFRLDEIVPGRYCVSSDAPPGTYLKSALYQQQDVTGKEFDLTHGAGGDLELVYRYGSAEVSGTIGDSDSDTGPKPRSVTILLMPDTLNADGSGMQVAKAGSDGRFSIKQVSPGHYRAYAIPEFDPAEMQDPDALKNLASSAATEVSVAENETKQVQLHLMSPDQLQSLLAVRSE